MILIKNGRVMDPETRLNEVMDILIDGSIIKKIGKDIEVEGIHDTIDASEKTVAPGLIDVHVHFRDPGLTYKEDMRSGSKAAARGGFTTVVCMANTKPSVDNEETLEYVLNEARKLPINVLQAAAVTKELKGVELVDMEVLKDAGAVGFTDDGFPIMNSSIVLNAMERARKLNVPISFHEEDTNLVINPGVNSGKIAEMLNLQGAMSLAENVMIARDCEVAIKTGARVNMQHVSTKTAVEILRNAKARGADIYAEVSPHHFTLTEKDVLRYGSNAKMNPPLRTEEDRQMLIKGLKDNTLNIIATDHAPHSSLEKQGKLENSPSGIIGLETALALGITYLVDKKHLTLIELLEKMTVNPANLYNLPSGRIKEGGAADIVIFDEKESWVVKDFYSKSSNSPFIGWELKGKVKYTLCSGNIVYRD